MSPLEPAAITALVERFFATRYSLRNLDPDEPLFTSGLIDSMALVMLVAFCEDEFKVRFPTADITTETFGTLRAISEGIRRKLDGLA